MLVIGGVNSLLGAVVGALLVSGLNSFLLELEKGVSTGPDIDVPTGTRLVTLGVFMAAVLLFRPSGITRGRELSVRLPRLRSRRLASE
jgi:branched-chain amino acid transport system permease protein